MTRNRAIIEPLKWKNFSGTGPVAVMTATEPDLKSMLRLCACLNKKPANLYNSNLYTPDNSSEPYALAGPFIGAPYAAMILETLIAMGADKVIFLGWCGSISPEVSIGDIIIPTSSVIDEGTSRHYKKESDNEFSEGDGSKDPIVRPSSYIVDRLKTALNEKNLLFHEGMVWSTDAFYRETRDRVKDYQKKGVLAVEMEASALFSVGRFRDIEVGAAFVVSDELSALTWKKGFREKRFKDNRKALHKAISALCRVL